MPALIRTNTPPILSFSMSPNVVSYKVTPWNPSIDGVFNAKVALKITLALSHPEEITVTMTPDNNGVVSLDLSAYLDPYLSFQFPNPYGIGDTIFFHHKKQGVAYEVTAMLVNDYEVLATATSFSHLCIKGGIGKESGDPLSYINNLYTKQRFLNFHADMDTAEYEGVEWLTLLVQWNIAPEVRDWRNAYATITVTVEDTLIEGAPIETTYTLEDIQWGSVLSFKLPKNTIFDVTERKVSVMVNDGIWVNYLMAKVSFPEITKIRPESYMLYHNSLGALNTFSEYTIESHSFAYDRKSFKSISAKKYIQKNVLSPDNTVSNSFERKETSIITDLLSQDQLHRLRDLFLINSILQVQQHRANHITIEDEDFEILTHLGMYTLALNYVGADSAVYTPRDHSATPTFCPIPHSLVIEDMGGLTFKAIYNFYENFWGGKIEVYQVMGGADPDVLLREIVLTEVSGAEVFSVDDLLPLSPGIFYKMKLFTKCGASYSLPLEVTGTLWRARMLVQPMLTAETHKGALPRLLQFYPEESNATDPFLKTENLNSGSGWKIFATLLTAWAGDPPSASTIKGGVVAKVGPNTDHNVEFSYTPPSADFTGMDMIEWRAWALNGGALTPPALSKMYIRVSDGLLTDHDTGDDVIVVYVKIIFGDTYNVHYTGTDINYDTFQHLSFAFFQDPLGITPVDVTGLGIDLLLHTENSDGLDIVSTISDVSGTVYYYGPEIVFTKKRFATPNINVEWLYSLSDSSDYFQI